MNGGYQNKYKINTLIRYIRQDFKLSEYDLRELVESQELLQLIMEHNLYNYFLENSKNPCINMRNNYDRAKQLITELNTSRYNLRDSFIVIKGIALNYRLYGNALVRSFGDLDILLDLKDVSKFHRALCEMGFAQKRGPTSAKKSNFNRAFLAANLAQMGKPICNIYPIKVHQDKPEYKTYCRQNTLDIELHDGLYYIQQEFIKLMIKEAETVYLEDTLPVKILSLECTFILLIVNTFENSESFFSNNYDFEMKLSDYIDIKKFIQKYRYKANWEKIYSLIEAFGIEKIAGIVLNNLNEIYGEDVTCNCLYKIPTHCSEWKSSIIERIFDYDFARRTSFKIMRNNFRVSSLKSKYIEGEISKCEFCEDVRFCIKRDVEKRDVLKVIWIIPKKRYQVAEQYFYQLTIFPLEENIEYISFKIDMGFYDGDCAAYGHRTKRLALGAIKKKTNTKFQISKMESEEYVQIEIKVLPKELDLKKLC